MLMSLFGINCSLLFFTRFTLTPKWCERINAWNSGANRDRIFENLPVKMILSTGLNTQRYSTRQGLKLNEGDTQRFGQSGMLSVQLPSTHHLPEITSLNKMIELLSLEARDTLIYVEVTNSTVQDVLGRSGSCERIKPGWMPSAISG